MVRSLNSAYSFFAGIDDQQAYNLKQNEDERKRLAEERAQQDQVFAEASRAQKLQEYATNQPIRDLAIQTAQEKLANFNNPDNIAARTLGVQSDAATATLAAQAQLAKLRSIDPLVLGKSQADALGATVAQTDANTALTLDRIASQANTFAKGDPILRANYADQLANAKTSQEKQALANQMGLNVTIGDGYFTFGDSPLKIPTGKLYQIVKNPSSGEAVSGNQLLSSATAALKSKADAESASTLASLRASNEAKNAATAAKNEAEARATNIANPDKVPTTASGMSAKPGSAAPAAAQKPLTPAEQEQQKLAFDAAARLAALKAASVEADAKASEARNKLLRLKQSLTAPPQDVQAASLEYNRLSKLADAERAKVK
jgi:hypothetical protein